MPLESGTKISDLNPNWPLGNDPKSQGDDHLRLIKSILQLDALSKADGGTVAGPVTFSVSPIGQAGASGTQIPIADDIRALAGVAPQTIVESDVLNGWQVWGDILIQWGAATTPGNGLLDVTFPTAFKVTPSITITASDASGTVAQDTGAPTAVGFRIITNDINSALPASRTVRWMAVGEAPDALKKPKVVDVAGVDGGGGGGIPEAPQNGISYARRNAAWFDLKLQGGTTGQVLKKLDGTDFGYGWADETGGGSGIPEAPADGNYYARRNNAWANADDAFLTPAEGDAAYAPVVHTHTESQITDLDKYSQAQTDALLADKVDVEVGGTTSRGQSVWVGSSAELAAITNGPGRDAQTLYFVLE